MKLRELHLYDFGPFKEYHLEFPSDSKSCILITGKNNAGKTTIIRALYLINSALRSSLRFAKYSSKPTGTALPKKYTQDIEIGSMIYHFEEGEAIIDCVFDNGKTITLLLDSSKNSITCYLPPRLPPSLSQLFGFLPPLGQLAQRESVLGRQYIIDCTNTTLAPLHFRNHLYHLISDSQYSLIQQRLEETWEGIHLQNYEVDSSSGLLTCLYEEGDFCNEIAWAGQGLQIWLQILTHSIRLSEHPVLILDEPEIFLHPEKQNDLIQLLKDYYPGTAIIATHSTELMSNVDITHIIHVQKDTIKSTLKTSSDLHSLESIRRSIGSSINLYASQFEDVDLLLFTEYKIDYDIVKMFASHFDINKKTQNIRLSGHSQWKHYLDYQKAYKTFFGKDIDCSILLDKDYYPTDFHERIIHDLQSKNVKITLTPGKEIENLFLEEEFLAELLPEGANQQELSDYLNTIYEREKEPSFAKYVEFAKKYSDKYKAKEYSTVHSELRPNFESIWDDKFQRHNLIHGKDTLAKVRDYFRTHYHNNLSTLFLSNELVTRRRGFIGQFLSSIF
ncbi:MAG: ATP-dependent endonuclease [Candidatus Hodarchaeota archaeon]